MLSLTLKEGELKGKDEVIASLNLRINEFQLYINKLEVEAKVALMNEKANDVAQELQ